MRLHGWYYEMVWVVLRDGMGGIMDGMSVVLEDGMGGI